MTISELVRPGAFTIDATDWLGNAYTAMQQRHIQHLPVVAHGELVGMLSESDVLAARERIGSDWWTAPVRLAKVRVAQAPAPPSVVVAADIMTPYPVTVRPEATLAEAVVLMTDQHVRHLPVVDASSTVVGMLTERDVRTAVGDPMSYRDSASDSPTQFRVKNVMTWPVVVVPFDRPLGEVARQFVDDRLGALPVVDAFGALIGIVSYVDVLRAFPR